MTVSGTGSGGASADGTAFAGVVRQTGAGGRFIGTGAREPPSDGASRRGCAGGRPRTIGSRVATSTVVFSGFSTRLPLRSR
ncbi:hypothetical protein A4R43_36180 [Amycolatopsis albispora]|uniref:Uncharacterized protein n=1 Tax=Amycolatopsis albispora TaxID=1804986 RepID=A0A344LGP4_9PSEU|nr:hypothetical protein A4R43_36180 [Amycolatopsis albispora]